MGSQNINREIKAGDKVKINLEVVAENGLYENDEQEKQFEYLENASGRSIHRGWHNQRSASTVSTGSPCYRRNFFLCGRIDFGG